MQLQKIISASGWSQVTEQATFLASCVDLFDQIRLTNKENGAVFLMLMLKILACC